MVTTYAHFGISLILVSVSTGSLAGTQTEAQIHVLGRSILLQVSFATALLRTTEQVYVKGLS